MPSPMEMINEIEPIPIHADRVSCKSKGACMDRYGERVGLGRVFFLRMFFPGLVESIPLLGTLFFVVDALVIFGSDRQTIHDRFADTIVVDLRREAP